MSANIRILLIEDDQDDIDLFRETLLENDLKAEYTILMQGNKIIDYLKQDKLIPDLVVMDLNLPKLHGREVLKLIKADIRFIKTPVVVLSTSSVAEEKEVCFDYGASDFISKPTTNEGFISMVDSIKKLLKR